MSKYDWLLFIHVLSAFALVTAIVMFWAVILSARGGPHPVIGVLNRPAGIIVGVGSTLALIFGIWLAIDLDQYRIWDGWVIAAIVLWAIMAPVGTAAGKAFERALEGGPDAARARQTGILLHGVVSVVVILILIDMIYKPGA